MFNKVLIANRGEIALRVIRACRELGIRTVAVYSTADAESLHVNFADQAVCIGGASPADSYLNIPRIIAAAEITDADAIHPGYGFLAENPQLSDICDSCNIAFIGPTAESIRLMGDKAKARKTVAGAGVPVIPGSDGPTDSVQKALEVAHRVGFPVMVKASAGGGGRGIRIAHTDVSLVQAFNTASREAEAAFSNGELYIEKFIADPRHVEVQVLADKHHHTIHLGERECSVQRRRQKVLEEAPSPMMTPKLRKELTAAAVRCCRAAKYHSAGTVEFIVDGNGGFMFLEMNTRIQVEHPVTEAVTGVDIVKEQIRVAAGEELRYTQKDISITGHAIEVRINAEDPDNGFRPSPGKITALNLPGGPGIRVDTHAYAEYVIPPYYDSLLGKIIAYGHDRAEAVVRMERAMEELVVEGISTTASLHKRILADSRFREGRYNLNYLENLLG